MIVLINYIYMIWRITPHIPKAARYQLPAAAARAPCFSVLVYLILFETHRAFRSWGDWHISIRLIHPSGKSGPGCRPLWWPAQDKARSEERRVGKESSSRWTLKCA